MRRVASVLLCLVLLLGGLCSGLCFAQTARSHACCHEKNHCGSRAPGMQSDQPLTSAQPVPVVVEPPVEVISGYPLVCMDRLGDPLRASFIPPLRTSVLRL